MKVEFRWFDREVKNLHPMTNVYNGRPREKVLQYRQEGYDAEQWQDVPTVKEELSMLELQMRASRG